MKTIPLMVANLKSFARNWRSIVLLIVAPLIFIGIIFTSFSTSGMRAIPVGIVVNGGVSIDEYTDELDDFLIITPYASLDTCFSDMKAYHQYLCIEVVPGESILLNLYYDNTRETIIYEVIQKLKSAIDLLQKQQSKEMASSFLTSFSDALGKIDSFDSTLEVSNNKIGEYIGDIDTTIADLRRTQIQLRRDLEDVDKDLDDVRERKDNLEAIEDDLYDEISDNLNDVEDNLNDIPDTNITHSYVSNAEEEVDRSQMELNAYHSMATNEFYQMDVKVNSYQQKSDSAKEMTDDIDTYVDTLEDTQEDLRLYQRDIVIARKNINAIKSDFGILSGVNADSLVNPIVVSGIPLYLAQSNEEITKALSSDFNTKDAIKGLNLISMQTMFPRIVLLITLFLSLLIAVYICLEQVNSPANARIKLVKHIFLPEFISLFFSTIIILIVPVLIILMLGEVVFLLPIIQHFGPLSIVLLLECSAFILLGILLGYLVKKESIALLVSSFVLVTVIFFSGFLYPIERMSAGAAAIAANSPGAVAMDSFYKLIFYEQGFSAVGGEISTLVVWCLALITASLIVKALRRA